jgi:hypothetical protein
MIVRRQAAPTLSKATRESSPAIVSEVMGRAILSLPLTRLGLESGLESGLGLVTLSVTLLMTRLGLELGVELVTLSVTLSLARFVETTDPAMQVTSDCFKNPPR